MTTAESVALIMGNDGQRWETPSGTTLGEVCETYGGLYRLVRGEHDKWIFRDGSTITAVGDGWNLGYQDDWGHPDDCVCWPEADSAHRCDCPRHQSQGCPYCEEPVWVDDEEEKS